MDIPETQILSARLIRFFAALTVCFSAARAESVPARYSTAADVPVTASSYVATGKTLDVVLQFAPPTGTSITVVKNTGLSFIEGRFTNLQQGQVVSIPYGPNVYRFAADYYGGSGNDLVLVWAETRLFAWGHNSSGGLGDGTAGNSRSLPVVAAGVALSQVMTKVSAGGGHTLGVCADGTLAAFGSNGSGQIAIENTSTNSLVPYRINKGALAGKTAIAVAAGESHSLALCSDGTVAAWGRNTLGQLGDGSTEERRSPVAVDATGALSGKVVVAIGAGRMHSLALCSDGTLLTWGWNDYGQLGDGTTTTRLTPVAVNGAGVLLGRTVVSISVGGQHNVALCSDGILVAWGLNSTGALGDGSNVNRPLPVPVVQNTGVLAGKQIASIAAGGAHTIVACTDGTIATWGSNFHGALGDGTNTDRTVPIRVNSEGVLAGRHVVELAAGAVHSVALCSDGTLAAWGTNGGSFGNGGFEHSTVPVATSTSQFRVGERLTRSFAGSQAFTTFALVAAPPAPAIGLSNGSSQAPEDQRQNDFGTFRFPQTPVGSSSVAQTFSIRNTGTAPLTGISVAKVTGGNTGDFTTSSAGAATLLPGATTTFTVTFTPVAPGLRSARVQVASSEASVAPFVLNVSGSDGSPLIAAYTSGAEIPLTINEVSASGTQVRFSLHHTPTTGAELMVVQNTGGSYIDGAFTGLAHGQVVSLSYDGRIYRYVANYFGGTGNDLVLSWASNYLLGWGENGTGKLGDGSLRQRWAPVRVNGRGTLQGKTVLAAAAGRNHTLALCSDGTLAAWGSNEKGQLGDGTTTRRDVPVAVSLTGALAGKTIAGIAAVSAHSVVVCSDGSLVAWGDNSRAQLGETPQALSTTPVLISATGALLGRKAVSVAAMRETSVAVCSDGTLIGCGNNQGLTGDGTYIPQSIPTAATLTGPFAGKRIANVQLGERHSLVLCTDGTVGTWGADEAGQLGSGLLQLRLLAGPVVATGALAGKTPRAIAAGGSHNFVLCTDGSLAGWGFNSRGQLGIATPWDPPSSEPLTVKSGVLAGRTVLAISAGLTHTHALCSDGLLAGWGDNFYGQTGDGDTATITRDTPVAVSRASLSPGERFVRVFSGGEANHSLALVASPPAPEITVFDGIVSAPHAERLSNSRSFRFTQTQIGTSRQQSFLIVNTGTAPLIGIATTLAGSANPGDFSLSILPESTLLPNASMVLTVTYSPTASGVRSAAIKLASNDADEQPFLINVHGFDGSPLVATYTTGAEVPLAVAGITATGIPLELNLSYIPAVATELVVVNNTGAEFISGSFEGLMHGQLVTLGAGPNTYRYIADYYGGSGNDLTLVPTDAQPYVWGNNFNGQVGNGSVNARFPSPTAVTRTGALAGKSILGMRAGGAHTLVWNSDGSVLAWGGNSFGALGIGSTTNRLVPTAVTSTDGVGEKQVVAVALGGNFSLALCSDSTVTSWGANNSGQLGDGTTANRLTPVPVNLGALAGKAIVAVAAGSGHSVGLCSDGTVLAWGGNNVGQLGDGTTSNQARPQTVKQDGGLANRHVIAIAAGSNHNVVLCSDGTVATWGDNGKGQLGDETTTVRLEPVLITGGALQNRAVKAIAAGEFHTIAVCSDGALVSWGENLYGQLGTGTFTASNVPVLVPATGALAGRTPTSLAAGRSHNLVQCSDGTLLVWGRNTDGQLGDGGSPISGNRNAPFAISAPGTGRRFLRAHSGPLAAHSTALVVSPPAPELAVFDSVNASAQTERQNNSGTFHFYQAAVGSSIVRTFTIANTGTAPLTGLLLRKATGGQPDDFGLGTLSTTTLAPGATTTFSLTFSPSAIGLRSATIELVSNDADESLFKISVDGGWTRLESWRQLYFGTTENSGNAADLAVPQQDGVTNLMKFATGLLPNRPSIMPGTIADDGGDIVFRYFRSKAAIEEGILFSVEWSDTAVAEIWSTAGVTETVTDRGLLEEVTARIPRGSKGARFMHLRVGKGAP